jgi:hypothetical protein
VKFEDAIMKALRFKPVRPMRYDGLEERPQTFTTLEKGDVEGLKSLIVAQGLK